MRTKEEIKELINFIQSRQNREIHFNEEEIAQKYENANSDQSLAIKILSIFGGLFASSLFIGFLFIAGLYDSAMGLVVLGIPLIIAGAFINKANDNTIVDTISISSYIIGFILLGLGLFQFELDENAVSLIFIAVAIITLYIVQAYIISFVSVLIISGGLFTLLISNDTTNLIHVYICLLAFVLTFVFLKEAQLLKSGKKIAKLYNPVRIALIFSFLAGLIFMTKMNTFKFSNEYIWISSVAIIASIIYVISHLLEMFEVHQKKFLVYAIAVIILLPTLFSPSISGAILIILLSFLVNYKTSLVIGIAAFIYFVSQYYYDLHYTLLTKSIVLFCSGVLFLVLYFLTHKKLKSDEKI